MAGNDNLGLTSDHTVRVGDGRALGYIEVGDPDGYPVISNHGGLSCRLDIAPAHRSAQALGLRVISPDRPGIGLSDPDPSRTMASWADDVASLADQVGLDDFAVLGWSFGGCFAQAVATHLGPRVTALALVASGIPPSWEGMHDQINRMDRHFLTWSRSAPGRAAERSVFHLLGDAARHAPHAYARSVGLTGPAAESLPAAIAEGLSDTEGVVADYRCVDQPWGFDPADLAVPTAIWQGDADDLVPVSWARRLHDAIDGSSLTVVPGATHFLWYDHWDDIFTTLSDAVVRPGKAG